MRVTILGGGISGLATAHYLRRMAPHVKRIQVVEASRRWGGWLHSERAEGFLFERGCRGVRPRGNGRVALELIEELGLIPETLRNSDRAKSRYILWHGTPSPVPSSALGMFRWPVLSRPIRAVLQDWRHREDPAQLPEDESLASFFERRFGSEVARHLVDAMVAGIYAGDIDQLSVRSIFPQLQQLEKQHGSVLMGALKSRWQDMMGNSPGASSQSSPSAAASAAGIASLPAGAPSTFVREHMKAASVSFRDGMETLPRALCDRLEQDPVVELLGGHSVRQLERRADGSMGVHVRQSDSVDDQRPAKTLEADHVISTIPSSALAPILQSSMAPNAFLRDAGGILADIPATTVAVVGLGYRGNQLPLDGFGFLAPLVERQRYQAAGASSDLHRVMGMVFDSCCFPEQGRPEETRLSVMMGGAHAQEDVESASMEDLVRTALSSARDQLGVQCDPDVVVGGLARSAIPQYLVGHESRLQEAEALLQHAMPHLHLSGNSYRGIGVADCIAQAKRLAQTLGEDASGR